MANLGQALQKGLDTVTGGLASGLVGGVLDLFGLGGDDGISIKDQQDLMQFQADLNNAAWQKQFTSQVQYNDPSAVAARYRNAGISPASAFDHNTVGISQATMSNPVTGYPAPSRTQQVPNAPQYMSSIAQLMSAVSGSRLSDAQANAINEKLFKELRAMDDAHEWQDLTNNLLAAYGDKKASAEVQAALQNIQKVASETKLADEQALTEAKKRLNMDCDIALKAIEKDLHGIKLKQAKTDLEYYRKYKEAELDNIFADTQEKQTRSQSNLANARDLNSTAEGKELANNISRATNLLDIDNALYSSDTLTFLNQANDKELAFQTLCKEVKKSSVYKNSDTARKVDASLEKFGQLMGIPVAVIASALKGAK